MKKILKQTCLRYIEYAVENKNYKTAEFWYIYYKRLGGRDSEIANNLRINTALEKLHESHL